MDSIPYSDDLKRRYYNEDIIYINTSFNLIICS